MTVAMYKCRQCGKVVTSDMLLDTNSDEKINWFDFLDSCVCSKRCFEIREHFFKSLMI
jgi:hypothetical protein